MTLVDLPSNRLQLLVVDLDVAECLSHAFVKRLCRPRAGHTRRANGEFDGGIEIAVAHLLCDLDGELRAPFRVRAALAPAVAVGRDEVDVLRDIRSQLWSETPAICGRLAVREHAGKTRPERRPSRGSSVATMKLGGEVRRSPSGRDAGGTEPPSASGTPARGSRGCRG